MMSARLTREVIDCKEHAATSRLSSPWRQPDVVRGTSPPLPPKKTSHSTRKPRPEGRVKEASVTVFPPRAAGNNQGADKKASATQRRSRGPDPKGARHASLCAVRQTSPSWPLRPPRCSENLKWKDLFFPWSIPKQSRGAVCSSGDDDDRLHGIWIPYEGNPPRLEEAITMSYPLIAL